MLFDTAAHRAMRAILFVVAMVAASIVFVACQRATGVEEPEPTPEPPGIEGSWSWSVTYAEDGQTMTESLLLTFSGERWIESWTVQDADGNEIDDWNDQGGWSATATTITKVLHEPYRDEGPPSLMVDKTYYWGDDEHTVLYVEDWRDEDGNAPHFTRLERAAIAPIDPIGTWTGTTGYYEEDENEHHESVWTVTIGVDGSFEIREEKTVRTNGNVTEQFVEIHSGSGTPDLDNYVINLTGIMIQHGADNEPEPWDVDTGRIAFAPALGGRILVSPLWNEPPYEVQFDDNHRPYGDYFLRLTKQS